MIKFCKKCDTETERYKDGRCKPCGRSNSAAYYAANTEKWRVYAAQVDAVKHRALCAAWREANRDKMRALITAWKESNPEARRIHWQNRKARKLEAGGRLANGLAEKLFKLQRGKCACCGLPLGDNYHLDHRMPLFLGGTNTDDNMQLLRSICNLQKGTKHPVDFMQQRGFLL